MVILPRDYGLDYDQFNPGQLQAIKFTLGSDMGIIVAPTGIGKSAIAAAVANKHVTTVLTHSLSLVAQYKKYGFVEIFGKNQYACPLQPGKTAKSCLYDKPERCALFSRCGYYQQRLRCKESWKRVMSYQYFLETPWAKDTDYLFLDEAHKFIDIMVDHYSFDMDGERREALKLPPFPSANNDAEKVCKWFDNMEILDEEDRDDVVARWLTNSSIRWYIRASSSKDRMTIYPLNIQPFCTFLKTYKTFFMSATLNPDVFMAETGLVADVLELPHVINQHSRPVYYVTNAPAISRGSSDLTLEAQAAIIQSILDIWPSDFRWLVHVTSWKGAHDLKARLDREDIVVPKPGSTRQQVKVFTNNNTPGLVAIAPSWREGLNLTDGLVRGIIIAKIPYKQLSGYTAQKALLSPTWYANDACQGVVQAAGRGVRHRNDFCVTYIVDAEWSRVEKYKPRWFNPIPTHLGA